MIAHTDGKNMLVDMRRRGRKHEILKQEEVSCVFRKTHPLNQQLTFDFL